MDFISKLGESDWMDIPAKKGISLQNLGRLLQLAVGLHSLLGALVNSFDGEFTPQSTERDVIDNVNKNISKLQVVDSSIIHGTRKEVRQVNLGATAQNSCNKVDKKQAVVKKPVPNRVVRCFNCNR